MRYIVIFINDFDSFRFLGRQHLFEQMQKKLRGGTRKVGDQEGEAKPLCVKIGCVNACCVHKFLCAICGCVKTSVCKSVCTVKNVVRKTFCRRFSVRKIFCV